MADFKSAPPAAPGVFEHIFGMLGTAFSSIPGILFFILKAALFVLLSLIVLPAMFIMLFLHKPWEDMLSTVMAPKKK
jgi:hypothetical protein